MKWRLVTVNLREGLQQQTAFKRRRKEASEPFTSLSKIRVLYAVFFHCQVKHLASSLCPVFVSMCVRLQPKKLFACKFDLLMYFTKLSSLLLLQCTNTFRKHLSDQFFGGDFLKINSNNSVNMAGVFTRNLKEQFSIVENMLICSLAEKSVSCISVC